MFLLDLGTGLLLAVIVSLLLQLEPSLFILFVGLVGALLPDWDMVPHLIRKRGKLDEWAHKHRDISHYPLLTVPLCGIVTGITLGASYGVILAVTMTAHYINDSLEIGWGIRWLFPFSNKYLCYRRVGDRGRRLYLWTPSQQDEIAVKFGDPKWHKAGRVWRSDLIIFIIAIVNAAFWLL